MNITTVGRLSIILFSAILLLFASGCDDIGVFAQIAVSEKISEGLLPEGASPSKTFNIGGTYDYMSTGGSLWIRDVTDRSSVSTATRWKEVSLGSRTSIQSIAATDDRIYLTTVREGSNKHEVELSYFTEAGDGTVTLIPVTNATWIDDGSSYSNVFLFCPNPNGDLFMNVLTTDASFGNEYNYVGSDFYSATDPATLANFTLATSLTGPVRYIDSGAFSGSSYVFSAIENAELASDNGILIDQNGAVITPTTPPTRPLTGLTWLPAATAFIAGGTSLDANNVYPIYALNGTNPAGDWIVIPGSSSNYKAQSFVDVSNTLADNSGDDNDLVLAGTKSFAGEDAIGYIEIVTGGDPDPANWSIAAGSNRSYAYPNNYLLSDLVDVSITAFALRGGYLYASTAGGGLWRLDTGVVQPSWSRE